MRRILCPTRNRQDLSLLLNCPRLESTDSRPSMMQLYVELVSYKKTPFNSGWLRGARRADGGSPRPIRWLLSRGLLWLWLSLVSLSGPFFFQQRNDNFFFHLFFSFPWVSSRLARIRLGPGWYMNTMLVQMHAWRHSYIQCEQEDAAPCLACRLPLSLLYGWLQGARLRLVSRGCRHQIARQMTGC